MNIAAAVLNLATKSAKLKRADNPRHGPQFPVLNLPPEIQAILGGNIASMTGGPN